MRARGGSGPSADPGAAGPGSAVVDPADDPLAGATIVVHDLSRGGGRAATPAAPPALVAPVVPPGSAESAAPPRDRWGAARTAARTAARAALLLGAGGAFGVFAALTWQGRQPVPVTFGTLGVSPKVEIRVQVEGAVQAPGVYRLSQGDRVEDAIKAAGGLAPHADESKLSLAQRVRDEQRLDVPSLPRPAGASAAPSSAVTSEGAADASGASGTVRTAPAAGPSQGQSSAPSPAAQSVAPAQPTAAVRPTSTPRPQATARPTSTARAEPTARATAFSGGRVNVNTATQAQLEQLPGLGATSAQRILAYRAANGPLRSLDDVRKAGVQEQFVRQAADYLAFD